MAREIQTRLFPARLGFNHRIARFGSSARLGGYDCESLAELSVELFKDDVVAVGVGIVEEEDLHFVVLGRTEGFRDKFGAESRAADADAEDIFKFAVRALDFAVVDFLGEGFDFGDVVLDFRLDFGGRGEFGGAKPVVPYHSVFVGVGDCAALERDHRRKRLVHRSLHRGQKSVVEIDSAYVQTEPQLFETEVVFFITFPRHN